MTAVEDDVRRDLIRVVQLVVTNRDLGGQDPEAERVLTEEIHRVLDPSGPNARFVVSELLRLVADLAEAVGPIVQLRPQEVLDRVISSRP